MRFRERSVVMRADSSKEFFNDLLNDCERPIAQHAVRIPRKCMIASNSRDGLQLTWPRCELLRGRQRSGALRAWVRWDVWFVYPCSQCPLRSHPKWMEMVSNHRQPDSCEVVHEQ